MVESIDFFKLFEYWVEKHKSIYSYIHINGLMFEEILYKTMTDCAFHVDWTPGSHKPGGDMVSNNISISCKSGKLNKSGVLRISGSRTTSHKTIEDKLKFFKSTKPDIYMCMTICDDEYHLIKFDSKVIKYGSSKDWGEDDKKWYYDNGPIKFKIFKSMSDQLWMKIDLLALNIKPIMKIKV